jgi:hypothetical protein
MPTILPLVNIFSESLEIWSHRNATQDEMMEFYKKDGIFKHFVNDKLISKIESYLDAAKYVAEYVGDNTIESFINKQLDNDKNYYAWKKAMPSRTPTVLSDYQQKYPNYDRDSLNNAINELNCVLSVGQFLFHGGLWNSSNLEMTAVSPLSTSFDPRLAYMETIHNGKAYDREQIDLFVIKSKRIKN